MTIGGQQPVLDLGRPRDAGALLATAFELFRSHLAVFLSLTLLVVAPIGLVVDGVIGRELVDGQDADPSTGVRAVSTFLNTLVVPSFVTALHVAVVLRLSRGDAPSVGTAIRDAGARLLPALATVILYSLAVALGFVLLIVPGIYLAVRLYFGAQAAVVDRAHPTAALAESGRLVAGSWWRVFGLLLLAAIIFSLLSIAVAALVGILAAVLDNGVAWTVARIFAQTVALSLGALFGTLLFFDLRARKQQPTFTPPVAG